MAARVATTTGKRRTLFIAVGLPGSGKSTLASKLRPEAFKVISQDQLKIDFTALQKYVQIQIKATDQHLYIDSCNHTCARREKLAQLGLDAGLQVVFLVFDYPTAVCKANLLKRVRKGEPHPSVNSETTAELAFSNIYGHWQSVDDYEMRTIRAMPGVSSITVYSFTRADELAQTFNARA